MKKPIKEKYLDEHFGAPWFIFGDNLTTGEVDVHSSKFGDIISLPKEDADKVVELHAEFMEKVYTLLGYDKKH
jgi:hypothetical protein